jgi:hypothetical protein
VVARSRSQLRNISISVFVALAILFVALRPPIPQVNAQTQVSLVQVQPPPSGAPGSILTLRLTLENNLADAYNFNISVTNLPAGVSVSNPGTILVSANQTVQFDVQLSTPTTINPATYNVLVQASGTKVSSGTSPNSVSASTFAQFVITGATATPTPTITRTVAPTETPGPICPEGSRDPGNDFGSALLILVDTPNNHGICEQNDEDWYKFGALGGKVYTLDITKFDAGLDLVIELYDADGQRLAINDDFFARTPQPTAAGIQTPVPTRDIGPRIQSWRAPRDGVYYVRIRDATSVGGANKTYTFVVFSESYGPTPATVAELCRDLFEEDGLPEEAKLITSNEVQRGHVLCPTGDADWIKFFGKAGKIYYIYTDTRPYRNNPSASPSNTETEAGADTVMYLADRDGTSIIDFSDDIDSPDGASLDSQIRFVPRVDGFYFVQVKNNGDIGNQFIKYDLVLTLCVPGKDNCGRSTVPSTVAPTTAPTSAPAATQTPVNFDTATPTTPTATPMTPTATAQTFVEQSQPSALVNGPLDGFADVAFEQLWRRTDQPVSRGRTNRSWVWGPRALMARSEGYLQAEGGLRQVQYFDKARMEVSDPAGDRGSRWFVTSGLLAAELVSGRMQIGDSEFVQREAAAIPVAGDENDQQAPTYASFTQAATQSAPDRTGADPDQALGRDGSVSAYTGQRYAVLRLAHYIPETGHNIPRAFWEYLNASGQIIVGDSLQNDRLIDWTATVGYPLSEPYWTTISVGGQQRDVLVQIFQRRVLTYTPSNTPEWRVEMGNVGRHYYRWRYGEDLPASQ